MSSLESLLEEITPEEQHRTDVRMQLAATIADAMEEKGFILREIGISDKRQMIFTLTDAGRKKIKEMQGYTIDVHSLMVKLTTIAEE